jgi:hypothetical protein
MTELPPTIPSVPPAALYTPLQVRLASFIGGPFAAIYTLHSNFKRIGLAREGRLTLYWGGAFVLVLLAALPFLPDKFPNLVIPLAYSFAAGGIAASRQPSKETILASPEYVRCSGWNVTLVCVVSLIAFCAIMFPLLFALDYLGVIDLAA